MEISSTEDLTKAYDVVIEQLKRLERPQLKLDEESLSFLIRYWNDLNSQNSPEQDYLPMLCILDHTKKGSLKFVEPLSWTKTAPKRTF